MRKIDCLGCGAQIAESDKAWDFAMEFDACPHCNLPLSLKSPSKKYSLSQRLITSKQTKNVLLTFVAIGPLVGAVPFLIMTPGVHKEGFLVIVFAYILGVIPACIAGLIFNSIITQFNQSKMQNVVLCGALSGALGAMPLLTILASKESLILIILLTTLSMISGCVCGYLSRVQFSG